ncbi:hypothetical protein ACLKMH_13345 [Psychromonas sp. KJ10-10]|uniref:DUF7281 domain-containing protein n=1 Tax=Psychromonas sp. KJ10-10 TaxID=3391823 RepID=UPI0039B4329E
MNKTLFEYCKKHLRTVNQVQLKANASLKTLAEKYSIGFIDVHTNLFHFNARDKQHLIEVVAQELNGIRLSDPYPSKQSRTEVAQRQRNEKIGALKVSEDFVLLNSRQSLCLNNHITPNSPLTALGHFICATEIETIEHSYIVLVENLIVMANLSRLNIPEQLQDALWIYRGDAQPHKQTGTAYKLFRRFATTHKLVCFADLDPSGLQICLTSGARQWLSISNKSQIAMKLQGIENEWHKQGSARSFLNNFDQLPAYCKSLFAQMEETQTTLKQEHILQHDLKLELFPLI